MKIDHSFHKYLLAKWKLNVGDCFILWFHSVDQLLEFKNLIT